MTSIHELNPKRVGFIGDVHGDEHGMKLALIALAKEGVNTVHQVGDFGLWNSDEGQDYLYTVDATVRAHRQKLFVTLGNHECYPMLRDTVVREDGLLFFEKFPNILFIPRAFSWEWAGKKFMSLGGANSIDMKFRKPNVSWWIEEQITYADEMRGREVGKVDVMITHDCPSGVPILEHGTQAFGNGFWAAEDIEYANGSRTALRNVVNVAKPEILLHGHWHKKADLLTTLTDDGGESYDLRSVCLDKERSNKGNIGIMFLDREEVEFHFLKMSKAIYSERLFDRKKAVEITERVECND